MQMLAEFKEGEERNEPMKKENFPPARRPLWKKELLCFLLAFLILAGCAFLPFLLTRSESPAFIGWQNYVQLFLQDDVWFRAFWNTVRLPLLLSAAAALLLRVGRVLLCRRFPSLPAGPAELVTVLLTVLIPVISLAGTIVPAAGTLTTDYAAHTIMTHMQDYGEYSGWFCMKGALPVMAGIALVSLLAAFLLWGGEQIVRRLVKVYTINKASKEEKGEARHG